MDEFVAASGRTVTAREDGSLVFDHVDGYLSPACVMDAEEFLQAKRDDELGRWRWPINPHIVCYPRRDQDFVIVMDETVGEGSIPIKRTRASEIFGLFGQAATAYFEAHPVRKPWHDAQAGEFWSVTHAGEDETCRVDDVNGTLRFVGVSGWGTSVSMPVTHHSITAAVRMIAEVTA